MKKSLALVLALIMVMGCMSFAAAEGERTVTLNRQNLQCLHGICDVKSVEDKKSTIALTYFITEEPQWKNEPDRYNGVDFIRLETTLGVPCEGAAFAGTHKDNLIAASSGYQFDGPFLKTSVSNGYHDKMTLNWYGTKEEEGKQVADTSNVLYTDEITYDIIPAYNPVPADKDRIAAIGASINHGSVAFDAVPAEGTTITVSNPNDYASSYQINNDGNITSGTSANINIGDLSVESPKTYTIRWYSGEGGNEFLVGTDTLTVSVRPEGYYSFAAYNTPVVIEEPDTQANITPEGGFLPTTSVELKYEFTEKKWEEVFYKYGEDNRIFLPLWFYLPGSAKDYFKIEYFGDESRPVEEDLKFLKDAQYFNVNLNDGEGGYGGYKYFHEGLVIAQVKYEGNNVIIEPQSGKVSWLIKWLDDNNVDHFHRVTFDVNISSSDTGIKLTNASPANDRVKFDTQAGANGSYSDGTVRYMLGEGFTYGSNTTTTTKLVRPSTDATSATVNGETAPISETDGAIELTVAARNNQSMTESFTVCWLDADNKIIKTERITISNCPTGAGVPWQKHWAPMDKKRINVQDKNLTSFFSYDNDDGKLLFKVDNNNAGTLNADKLNELSQNDLIYEITPPEGAKYFRMSGQHSPLYDTYFADSTKQWLEKQPFENCVFENGAAKPYYYSFGKLFNRTQVEGVYVYTVNNTQVTFADMLVFQWYDADEKLMEVNGKNGEYLYLIKEPYVKISETKASTETPQKEVENPTIVVSNAEGNEILSLRLRAEIPIQKAVNLNSNTKYLYMKLKYIDESTGLEVEPGAAGAVVYLAYPDGMTYYNFKDYTVKLTHYTDENHVKHENVTLEATLIGLKFKTDSFSPFLLEWTPKGSSSSSSSSGGSGGLSGVDITNRTNREILSYRLGGGLLTFRLAGSGDVIVTENGKVVKPDADGWYNVSAGARIVVDYPVMVLPKTGDMPVWRWLLGL
ncbi:MAG: hypothetical protein Q4C92_05780 [Clostridia bacterium]|nr:hypothetical protein [Clostridia bacterium]